MKIVDDKKCVEHYEYEPDWQPIENKIWKLLKRLPTPYKLKDDLVQSYKNLTIERRNLLLQKIDLYIDNLERHLTQWKEVRRLIKFEGVQRIK